MKIQELKLRQSSHYNGNSKLGIGTFWNNHKKWGYIAKEEVIIKLSPYSQYKQLQEDYYYLIQIRK